MSYNTGNKSSLVKWLKRIFSIQTLSFVVAVVAAVISYKMYKATIPPQISIGYIEESDFWEYPIKQFSPNITSFTFFMPSEDGIVRWRHNLANGLLIISNENNKTINNLNLDILISYDNLKIDLDDISSDFTIVKLDTLFGNAKLLQIKYKYNILNAHSQIPLPISKMRLSSYYDESEFYLSFDYTITYDGIDVPSKYYVENWVYRNSNIVSVGQFLDKCYHEYWPFDKNLEDNFFAVAIPKKMMQIIPPSDLNENDFENFKKRFLQEVKNVEESK